MRDFEDLRIANAALPLVWIGMDKTPSGGRPPLWGGSKCAYLSLAIATGPEATSTIGGRCPLLATPEVVGGGLFPIHDLISPMLLRAPERLFLWSAGGSTLSRFAVCLTAPGGRRPPLSERVRRLTPHSQGPAPAKPNQRKKGS